MPAPRASILIAMSRLHPARRSIHDLTFPQLEAEIVASGLSATHARTLWRALHRDAESDLAGRRDFLPPLQRWIGAHLGEGGDFFADWPVVESRAASSDGLTTKLLLRLRDGQTIESVLMSYPGRFTACLSTQAGCAMGCVFCATGQMGFARHLRPGEIVAQVLHAQRELRARGEPGLRNLVLMGMGEPLHNYDAVMAALEIITDRRGLNLAPGRITISTVGGARHSASGGRRAALPSRRESARGHGASSRRARAREPPLAAGRAHRRLPHLRREDEAPNFF